MSSTSAIEDELTSINAIFDEETFSPIDANARLFSLRLPSFPSVILRVEFPADYPDAPPSILGTQSVGDDVPKGMGNQAVDVVRDVLAQVYRPGEVCIYDLLEDAREALEKAEEHGDFHLIEQEEDQAQKDETAYASLSSNADFGPEPPWTVGERISEKKSIFLARVAPVSSPQQAKEYVAHLLATDKKVAKATHNMTSWRIKGPNNTVFQDCNDDGESAAGSRMLHLMQLMDVWNVMIVVTRWYGGVHLGPDRFRLINTAAREALVLGGFVKDNKEEGTKRKGKK